MCMRERISILRSCRVAHCDKAKCGVIEDCVASYFCVAGCVYDLIS